MNVHKAIIALSLLLLPLTGHCAESIFEHKAVQAYPHELGFIPVQDVLTSIEPLPANMQEDLDLIFKQQGTNLIDDLPKNDSSIPFENGSIFLSGSSARKKNSISSLGYDPYQPHTLPPAFSHFDYTGPIIHHCTIAIAQHLLKKSGSKTVIPAKAWLYHLENKGAELDDKNYLLIQGKIPGQFKQFKALTGQKKEQFLRNMDIENFHAALTYIHYAFPNEDTLYVNSDDHTLMMPMTLSPDNEGLGKYTKYGKAILGQDLAKAKHNIRNWYDGGHKEFEAIIKKYGDNETVEIWNALYETNTVLHN